MNTKKKHSRRLLPMAAALCILLLIGAALCHHVTAMLYPMRYSEQVESCCREFGVSESLAYAVIHTESGFDPLARSELGAMGLMQIMPETFYWLQTKLPAEEQLDESCLYDPAVNIRYGVYFLSLLKQQFGEDTLAVAAYHAGQGRVSGWLSSEQLPHTGCTAADIPSPVTGHYVTKVERSRMIYRRLYSLGE